MRIFFDFDNTVTLVDVLNELIERFSVRDDWMVLEQSWQLGEITTKECLTGQMKGIRISNRELVKYLKTVRIDPYFLKLIDLSRRKGVGPVIVSDNFEQIINIILENNGIKGVPIYANHLTLHRGRLSPFFPYQNPGCPFCAHCKKIHFMNETHSMDDPIIYVGDGRSDICAAKEADIIFAKDALLKYFRKNDLPCVEFCDLAGIYEYLKEDFAPLIFKIIAS